MAYSRQLAAIMFTDIVNYTALMGDDENKAFEILQKNRKLQQLLIENHNGRLIKEMGDGVLAIFFTVTDAVLCATQIQEDRKSADDFQIRIGIHLGEVVLENNDVFGDGVNIASRLQAIAPIGGIYISESVYKNISNKKEIRTRFIRNEFLKHIKEPVSIYEIMVDDSIAESPPAEIKRDFEKSIAVLPFVNMSNDPEQEYFSDGMSEEILNSLAHLKYLKVAGRTSSFQFKGKNVDLREVGEKLRVNTILEGSVRKQGNRLRVTAQLINVEDGFHLWSERYDRNMDDIFAVQDEIALMITEKLKVTLLSDEKAIITKPLTHNTEAYELYLKGRFYLNRRGKFITAGIENLKKAITIDPDFALAHAGYADAIVVATFWGFFCGKEVMHQIKESAERAIKIDDSLAEPYSSLGSYYTLFEWNWAESKRNFIKSIELNPRNAQAHSWYGMLHLSFQEGNFDEAENQGRTAIKNEPLSPIDYADFAWTLYTEGKFGESLSVAKTGIDLDANSFLSYRIAALCYIKLKLYDDAIDTFKHMINISDRHQHAITGLIWAYCSKGNFDEAEILMEELKMRAQKEYIAPMYFGIAAAYAGDIDMAFDLLQKAYDDHDPNLTQLKYSPYVPEILRSDQRFTDLLQKINFPN